MIEKYKNYIPVALAILALVVIFVVGHRHWFMSHGTPVEVRQERVTTEKPVAVRKPAKPAKRAKVVKEREVEPQADMPEFVPAPIDNRPWHHGIYRTCDFSGWCWTHFPWEP